jgi:choline dehydrogenase-like flavoprotein
MTVADGIVTGEQVEDYLRVDCDVVVVGSGAGGATMAAELAAAGVDVVVVEEGGYHPTASFTPSYGRGLRTLYRDGGLGLAIGSPPVLFSEGRCVGGSTVVNGGMSFRTPESTLDRWAREESVSAIGPAEMQRHFRAVERRLHVAHQDPETIGRDSELLKAGAGALGWRVIANTRNQIHCAGTNNCVLGCPTGAKRSMLVTNVPRALAHGARLFADCRVARVTRRGRTATGVEGRFTRRDGRGARLTVRAKVVVVAGGAVQTPALLLRSGFRSPSGLLGRNLSLHPNAKLVALFDQEVRGWQGVHQAFQVREFARDGILITAVNIPPALVAMGAQEHGRALGELMDSYDRMVTAGCLVEDSTRGSVRHVPGVGTQAFYQINDEDAARVAEGVALTAELLFAAGARRILSPFRGVPDLYGMDDVAALRSRPVPKRSMELFTVHLMGTARMSEDPRRGVVSSYGEFHGARGLFVADASVFPGPIGVNPMLTIVALATRNAEWLLANRSTHGI